MKSERKGNEAAMNSTPSTRLCRLVGLFYKIVSTMSPWSFHLIGEPLLRAELMSSSGRWSWSSASTRRYICNQELWVWLRGAGLCAQRVDLAHLVPYALPFYLLLPTVSLCWRRSHLHYTNLNWSRLNVPALPIFFLLSGALLLFVSN